VTYRINLIRFAVRTAVFIMFGAMYLTAPQLLDSVFEFSPFSIRPWVLALWLYLLCEMAVQLIPRLDIQTACGKGYKLHYTPVENYDRAALRAYTKEADRRASMTAAVWLAVNAAAGILYARGIIGRREMLLLCMFYYVCDLICVIFWCPFQTFFQRNRCCVTCRMFNWGYFMLYTPFVFIKSFFTTSLFLVSLVILIVWEYCYHRYPERFWEGSNASLRCMNCSEKMCTIKKRVADRPFLGARETVRQKTGV